MLARLRRDTRGNVLMMMAAMLLPLAAFAGAAIDVGRLYAVKSRLQQACDAGVLAGAKFMDPSATAPVDTSDSGPAKTFFKSNFQTGWFSTAALSNTDGSAKPLFTPVFDTSNNHVTGSASVTVPMTLMKVFGQSARTINVTCEAQFDGDVDIMFVLDTTGSMACAPEDDSGACGSWITNKDNYTSDGNGGYYMAEKSGANGTSRLAGVRSAVATFYDTVMNKADSSTAFRFGFVPFSSMVNVGVPSSSTPNSVGSYLQQKGYLATSWNYQSRSAASNNNWVYQQITKDTSQYILGNAVSYASQGGSASSTWNGCVEERGWPVAAGLSSSDPANPTLDLDVDHAPTVGNASSYWGPAWPDIIFYRNSNNETTNASRTNTYRNTGYGYAQLDAVAALGLEELACPGAAMQRLSAFQLPAGGDRSALKQNITNYLKASNGFRPWGTTYLDEGMTWGTRLIAPKGIFAADTKPWPGHAGVNRYLILLTDGAMETDCYAYSSHGMEAYDQRVLATGSTCTALGASQDPATALNTAHYSRLATACSMAKNRAITVFVILFGQSVDSANKSLQPPQQFKDCATAGQAFFAKDAQTLTTVFNNIAAQVALLRLSK